MAVLRGCKKILRYERSQCKSSKEIWNPKGFEAFRAFENDNIDVQLRSKKPQTLNFSSQSSEWNVSFVSNLVANET